MKRNLSVILFALIGPFLLAVPGSAQHSGLWVGTATLKYVSEVNKQYSDLSFDLGLVGVRAYDTLINEGEAWIYNDTGTELEYPDPDWTDDSAKKAPYGFGYPKVVTAVSNRTAVYFRKYFDVSLPVGADVGTISDYYSNLKVRLWRDDGIVLYLNGTEIFRNNLPTGSVDFNTFALSEIKASQAGDNTLVEFTLPANLLKEYDPNDPNDPGDRNVLAAEVHLAEEKLNGVGTGNPDTTDLLFDLELTAALKDPVITQLIASEANDWKYHDSICGPGGDCQNVPLDTDWQANGYDDSGWSTGQGQFGYGEGDEATTVSADAPTVYFRKTFSGDSAGFTHLRVLLLRDDGAVVYMNGVEILRSNMPPGDIAHDTPPVKALGSADEGRYIVADVDTPTLAGTNVLAVEIHQHPTELGGPTGTAQGALTRTSAPLDLRLLFHVDSWDQVRLLKEVIQVYDSINEEYVLLTDHTLVPNYTGVAIRDGVPVGRRLSAVGFDFTGTSLECSGAVSKNSTVSGTVTCDIELASNHPTNPFLHRYHPDHDNWDERYENVVEEAYAVTREIKLEFNDRYPPDEDLPVREVGPAGWGDDLLGGYYTETLTGLHKEAITVHGPFILRRVVTTPALTP